MIKDKNIVLGVTGSIAAYKAADIASKLTQGGARVNVIMTQSAQEFINPMTFRSITGRPVVTQMFELASEFSVEHVALAEAADLVVIAPATANVIAKLAAGISNDMLTCTVLATKAPLVLAPAMNVNMYENPITQANLAKLKDHGAVIVEPGYGRLASGRVGMGRLADNEKILGTISLVLARNGNLAGKSIVITAGGTQEPIDPVRYISNRSSGKMGYAIAQAARDRGAKVLLISAPTYLPEPLGVEVIRVGTATQMYKAVLEATPKADVLIMAAAVADYQPSSTASSKIKKKTGKLVLELVNTPDILKEVSGNFIRVGFAAETDNLISNATDKLKRKRLDLIVANDVTLPGSGFGSDSNKVVLIDRNNQVQDLPLLPKQEVADLILDHLLALLPKKRPKLKTTPAKQKAN
jgi:phosphopantothenoylcysteine decarboxylase / phosphopantothenate---cysteine ligase